MIHSERILDVDRAFAFDAETPIACDGKTIFDRLFQPLIDAFDEFLLRELFHRFIVPRKQTPRRIEPEQRHGVEAL